MIGRRVVITLTFVPCLMFLLGLVIGVLATEEPLEIG